MPSFAAPIGANLLELARAELEHVEELAADHGAGCRGCAVCVSLAGHVARSWRQVGLIEAAAVEAEPAALF